MKHLKILFLFSFVVGTISCSNSDDDDILNLKIDRQRIDELINLSNDQVTIEGTTLELHTYLQRDFMPISPPNGRGLVSVNWIVDIDSVSIPETIQLIEQYVINGDSLWTTTYKSEDRSSVPYEIDKVSFYGPKWQPNKEVTVIARLVNSTNNSEYFLIKYHQLIERTE